MDPLAARFGVALDEIMVIVGRIGCRWSLRSIESSVDMVVGRDTSRRNESKVEVASSENK